MYVALSLKEGAQFFELSPVTWIMESWSSITAKSTKKYSITIKYRLAGTAFAAYSQMVKENDTSFLCYLSNDPSCSQN